MGGIWHTPWYRDWMRHTRPTGWALVITVILFCILTLCISIFYVIQLPDILRWKNFGHAAPYALLVPGMEVINTVFLLSCALRGIHRENLFELFALLFVMLVQCLFITTLRVLDALPYTVATPSGGGSSPYAPGLAIPRQPSLLHNSVWGASGNLALFTAELVTAWVLFVLTIVLVLLDRQQWGWRLFQYVGAHPLAVMSYKSTSLISPLGRCALLIDVSAMLTGAVFLPDDSAAGIVLRACIGSLAPLAGAVAVSAGSRRVMMMAAFVTVVPVVMGLSLVFLFGVAMGLIILIHSSSEEQQPGCSPGTREQFPPTAIEGAPIPHPDNVVSADAPLPPDCDVVVVLLATRTATVVFCVVGGILHALLLLQVLKVRSRAYVESSGLMPTAMSYSVLGVNLNEDDPLSAAHHAGAPTNSFIPGETPHSYAPPAMPNSPGSKGMLPGRSATLATSAGASNGRSASANPLLLSADESSVASLTSAGVVGSRGHLISPPRAGSHIGSSTVASPTFELLAGLADTYEGDGDSDDER